MRVRPGLVRLVAVLATQLGALSSCGPRPDLVSDKGVSFFFIDGEGWPKPDIDEQESWFVARLDPLSNGYHYWDVEREMRVVEVDVYKDPIPCGKSSPTGLCEGLQYDNVLQVHNKGCVFNSAYTHELMHWLQESIKGYTDYDHGEQNIWPIADGAPHGCYP